MVAESHYDKMKRFLSNTGKEIETKKEKLVAIEELINLDQALLNVGEEAQIYMRGLSLQVAKAKALSAQIDKYSKDPKLREIVRQQMARYNEFLETYIKPVATYIKALYKIGILEPAQKAGEIFNEVDALFDKCGEYKEKDC